MIQQSLQPLFANYFLFSKEDYKVHNLLNYVQEKDLITVHKNGINVTIDGDNLTIRENRNLVLLVNNRIKKKVKCEIFHESSVPPNIKVAFEEYLKTHR